MESREFSPIDVESNGTAAAAAEMLFAKRCYCFYLPCLGSSSNGSSPAVGFNWWHRMRTSSRTDEGLWTRGINALKKLREWSEIVAGPKWKTFIRRFNRNKSGSLGGGGGRSSKFQYDPLSYALNFDEGPGYNVVNLDEDDEYLHRNFSSRYASIPLSTKGSMAAS